MPAYIESKVGDPPTKKQKAILEWIKKTIRDSGCPPTVREIAAQFKIKSPNGMVCHLKALEKKGYLGRGRLGSSRSWMPVVEKGMCRTCGQQLPGN